MADWVQGLATFPGIDCVKSARYTLQHGVTPGVCTMTLVPQQGLPTLVGPLVFTFGALRLTFPDCRVDHLTTDRNDRGEIYTLQLFDRRWRWEFGSISGHYNFRMDDGELDPELEKTPQELAKLCLVAMGESRWGFDVSQLPNTSRPEVNWDHDNPARALAQLCEDLGCRVVLRLDGRVQLCRVGVGLTLPFDTEVVSDTLAINPPERPDSLLFVAAPTSYQVDFVLEAVGLDTDGSIVPIDDLSYKPAGGWAVSNPPYFSDVATDSTRKLAQETVFRWYRITNENPDGSFPLLVPGYGEITWLDQLLPIDPLLNETIPDEWNDEPGDELFITGHVFGTYWNGGPSNNDTSARTPYRFPYELDGSLGIVKFDRPVLRFYDVGTGREAPYPATLYLRATCQVKDAETWALDRWERTHTFPGPHYNTGPRILKSDEVYLRVIPTYDTNTGRLRGTTDNKADLLREAQYQFTLASQEYQTTNPQEVLYRGLRAFNPDGAIQSVTWSVSDELPGAETRAARNDEFAVIGLSYRDRRRMERLNKADVEKSQKQQKALQDLAARKKLFREVFGA